MFRSFCLGALFGFLFGSSKKGHDVREGIDGFLTELTSSDAMKRLDEKKGEFTKMASPSIAKFSTESQELGTAKGLDADKAQELADKLGAKPSAPEDENLTAFTHPDEDLKSA